MNCNFLKEFFNLHIFYIYQLNIFIDFYKCFSFVLQAPHCRASGISVHYVYH